MSVGQNILIKPSFSGMSAEGSAGDGAQKEPLRRNCSLAETPAPVDRGCCVESVISQMLLPVAQPDMSQRGDRKGLSYQVRLLGGQSFHGDEYDEVDEGQERETFGGACLDMDVRVENEAAHRQLGPKEGGREDHHTITP